MLSLREIRNLPAYTQTGKYLGRVVDFEVEPSSHTIVRYHIRHWPGVVGGLWKGRLVVSREQVVSLTPRALVVVDDVVPERTQTEAKPVAP